MSVDEVLAAVAQTPLPNLLVVGGLVFLFLAIVGKIGAKIVVTEQRQKMAAVIGSALLLIGLGIQFVDVLAPDKEPSVDTGRTDDQAAETPPASKSERKSSEKEPIPRAAEPETPITRGELPVPGSVEFIALLKEAWLTGHYDAALDLFDKMRSSQIAPGPRRLAHNRYEWLSPYRGRIFFADDFEIDTISSGSRWNTFPGAPPTGRGGAKQIKFDDNAVLQLQDHYHAAPRIERAHGVHTFEIRMRFRAETSSAVGAHINLMMDEPGSRTTVGLYVDSGELSIWEYQGDQEIGRKTVRTRYTDWHQLTIAVQEQSIRVHLNTGLVIDYRSPRARPISLIGFNLETLSGTMWFDDVLVTAQ